ncbi:MAG: hypothetical protein PVJ53_14375, partial [Desulfobacterales bacterium]
MGAAAHILRATDWRPLAMNDLISSLRLKSGPRVVLYGFFGNMSEDAGHTQAERREGKKSIGGGYHPLLKTVSFYMPRL